LCQPILHICLFVFSCMIFNSGIFYLLISTFVDETSLKVLYNILWLLGKTMSNLLFENGE